MTVQHGADWVLFRGMTRSELHTLACRIASAAGRQVDLGEYDTARELNRVWLDLDVAWWQNLRHGTDENRPDTWTRNRDPERWL